MYSRGSRIAQGIGRAMRLAAEDIEVQNDQSTTGLHDTTISIRCPVGGALTIWWGDGTASVVVCNNVLNAYTHTYTVAGRYTIRVTGTTRLISDFRCYSQAWIYGALSAITRGLGPSLTVLYLYSDPLLTGDLSDLSGLTGLTVLYLYLDPLLTYAAPHALPAWAGADLRLYSCGLSTAEVDQFLIDLADGCGAGGGAAKPLRLDGTNAARSHASDAAVATLTAAGWVVQANGP